jgi:hypothetical protein
MSHARWGYAMLRDSTDAAVAAAMKNCKSTATDPCKIVMIDDKPAP